MFQALALRQSSPVLERRLCNLLMQTADGKRLTRMVNNKNNVQ